MCFRAMITIGVTKSFFRRWTVVSGLGVKYFENFCHRCEAFILTHSLVYEFLCGPDHMGTPLCVCVSKFTPGSPMLHLKCALKNQACNPSKKHHTRCKANHVKLTRKSMFILSIKAYQKVEPIGPFRVTESSACLACHSYLTT